MPCGELCEPMCRSCNELADQAAQDRNDEWEDAGYFDVSHYPEDAAIINMDLPPSERITIIPE